MHRKEAGEFLHYVNAINAIMIAGSGDIVASVRYHTKDTLMHVSKYSLDVSKYLHFCIRALTIASFY